VCIHVWIHIFPQIYAERDTFVIISHYSVCIYMDTYLSIDIRRERHIVTICHYFVCIYMDTGWRRLIGSPKLQIIFHKRATKYRALLRKMTYRDKASYESSPPCTYLSTDIIREKHTCTHTHPLSLSHTRAHIGMTGIH